MRESACNSLPRFSSSHPQFLGDYLQSRDDVRRILCAVHKHASFTLPVRLQRLPVVDEHMAQATPLVLVFAAARDNLHISPQIFLAPARLVVPSDAPQFARWDAREHLHKEATNTWNTANTRCLGIMKTVAKKHPQIPPTSPTSPTSPA